jgi:ATP-dependent helicase/nuclease subunit B
MAEHASADPERSTVVVNNALTAQQWEMHLAAASIAAGAFSWETPPVKSYAAWLDDLWLEHADERGPALTAKQQLALWRRIVADSAESSALIGHAGAAEWAADAWQQLRRWQIDPTTQRAAANQVDYRAFLAWCGSYREWLAGHDWIDQAGAEAALAVRVSTSLPVVTADLTETYPARAALFARLASQGTKIEHRAAPPVIGAPRAARLADAADELRAAFHWAKRQLDAEPLARVAIVVPTTQRHDEIERLAETIQLTEVGAAAYWSEGRTLATEPTLGAAVDALTLLGPHAPHVSLGRWLRSPFFAAAHAEGAARARIDADLRNDLRSQLPFDASYRSGLKELLENRAPQSARSLADALAVVGSLRRATPGRWAHVFARALAAFGWQPPVLSTALGGWQSTLDELGRLTPIVGEVSLDGALSELTRLLERTTTTALPLYGVHVLRRIEDVGPGYSAVWATGFTDAAWPEPPHGNPLLPLALQRQHDMPYSSPRDAEERSQRALERLVRRCRNLVVSWPARVYDYETEPSPAIRLWPQLASDELDALRADAPLPSAARETAVDPAPPFGAGRVPGGTGALGRQARCPVRAFCQDRLGARPLEALAFGVPARLRGIAAHRAAEHLLGPGTDRASLAAKEGSVAPSAERALAHVFGRARAYLAPLYGLELEQLQRVLRALLREEAGRAPFVVRAAEQEAVIALGPLTFNVRVDRIDELADGTVAIVDYKTGERATGSDWFGERLRDAQVPLYATETTERVNAAVVTRLSLPDVRYFGFWRGDDFPGRPSRAAHPDPDAQIELWRAQVALLAAEFAAGDTRIFTADYDEAAGAYAPLTRVFEQLALVRGAAVRW